MEFVRRYASPRVRSPLAIVALEGWGDAGDAATGALGYLIGDHEDEPYAVIEGEEFFDFQERRPIVVVDDGGARSLDWPVTRLVAVTLEGSRDVIGVLGEEPNLRWRTFAQTLVATLAEDGVEEIITLGAFVGQVAHTVPVPVIGVATDPDLVSQHGLLTSRYEGPTAMLSVILEAARDRGLTALSLWAATPHYLAANSNPKAMVALLEAAERVGGIQVDLDELRTVATEFEEKVNEAMEMSDDLTAYVRKLEESAVDIDDMGGEQAGEQLVADIEDFLREQS